MARLETLPRKKIKYLFSRGEGLTFHPDRCRLLKKNLFQGSFMARLEGFEPPTFWFVAKHSIQLSYRRIYYLIVTVLLGYGLRACRLLIATVYALRTPCALKAFA